MERSLVDVIAGQLRDYFREGANTIRIGYIGNGEDVLGTKPLSLEEGDSLFDELEGLIQDTFFDLHYYLY